MNIIVPFADAGSPSEGLSATITIWTLDGTVIKNAQAMTEIAGGMYYYDFSDYDSSVDYAFRADGSATLGNLDRYKFGSNDANAVLDSVLEEEGDYSLRDIGKILLSQLAGEADGGGTAEIIFKSPDGAATRITMVVDENGNRSNVTINT